MTSRTKENDSESDNSNENDETEISIGDRVAVGQDGRRTPARAVDLPDATAAEFEIEALDQTVAECNPDHPDDAAVVGVRFERKSGGLGRQTYHYPATRLERVDGGWTPEPSKSSGQREREELIDEHAEKLEAFAACVKYLARYPEIAADWFDEHYDPHIRPDTRGECCHARDDRYRPNTPGAICCWTCNGGGRRPAKFMADEPVPASAPCRAQDARDPSETLTYWVGFRVAPAIPIDQDVDRTPNPASDRLHWDAEDLRSSTARARRSAMLRIAYQATLGGVLDETYNVARTCAYLRDLGVDTNAALPGGDPWADDDGDQDSGQGGDRQ